LSTTGRVSIWIDQRTIIFLIDVFLFWSTRPPDFPLLLRKVRHRFRITFVSRATKGHVRPFTPTKKKRIWFTWPISLSATPSGNERTIIGKYVHTRSMKTTICCFRILFRFRRRYDNMFTYSETAELWTYNARSTFVLWHGPRYGRVTKRKTHYRFIIII